MSRSETQRVAQAAPGWFARLTTGAKKATGVRAVFGALQDAIARTAAGAARTSMRLGSVTAQIRRTNEALSEMLRTARALNSDIRKIEASSQHTDAAAREMKTVASDGRSLSRKGADSALELQAQMASTVQRIDRLLENVQAVMQASKVIDDIARQTQLLGFNASIEAARAGEQGSGFAVVAREIGSLAHNCAARTREIDVLLLRIKEDLAPAREAVARSEQLVQGTATHAQEVGLSMERLTGLSDDVAAHMQSISGAVGQQREGLEGVLAGLNAATEACGAISKDAQAMTDATFALSTLTEDTFKHFERMDTGTVFHRSLGLARELASRAGGIFERAIDAGRFSLQDALAFEYLEIRGTDINSLAHLFDVSRVPSEGFQPPKYRTRYDAAVDEDLQRVMDEIKSKEPALIFALLIDLNSYGPIHNTEYCKDWTGDPGKDLVGNRIKRFFTDQRVLVRGARVGLANASGLPDRATRAELEIAGRGRSGMQGEIGDFLVQTYARDTGAIVTALTAPVFIKGQRWGAVLLGWNSD